MAPLVLRLLGGGGVPSVGIIFFGGGLLLYVPDVGR